MASELVERVARAIYESMYDADWPPEPFDSGLRTADGYRETARAAIAAMRRPTEGMLDAVRPLSQEFSSQWREHADWDWRVMIDVALVEG